MRRLSALAVGAVALAVAGAGCGGGSASNGGLASSTARAARTAPASASAAAAAPANVTAKETNPSGDIPDNQAYVAYAPPRAGYSVKVPEGWSRTASGGAVTFTDKLNAVRLEEVAAPAAPTIAGVRRTLLSQLARTERGFRAGTVTMVARHAGPAVRITYLARSAPDSVTGKSRVDAVERYLFFHKGREAVIRLSGPRGADNVDPWRIITDSLRWKR
jgi:hypothetical protein